MFVFFLIAARDEAELVQKRPGLVRSVTATLAVAITAGAAFWVAHLPNASRFAYVLIAAVGAGGVMYLGGTLLGHGRVALGLRRIGWALMALPLFVPSTFSLALPVVAGLAITLRPLPPEPERARPSSDVLAPR